MINQNYFDLGSKSLFALAFFISFLLSLRLDLSRTVNNLTYKVSNILLVLILTLYSILVGFRDLNIGSDTLSYYGIWEYVESFDFEGEYVFSILMLLLKSIGGSFSLFLFLIVLLFSFYLKKSLDILSNIFNFNSFLVLFSFMSFFFFESITINVIRQGVALSLLLYSWSIFITQGKKKYYLFYLFLAVFTHFTSIIPIGIYFLVNKLARKIHIRYYLLFYLLGIVFAGLNFGILNVAPFLKDFMGDSRRVSYLTNESDLYTVGFKPQFVVFNTLFLLVGYFVIRKYNVGYWYITLYKYFIFSSFLFFMWFQIPYSDRVGLYSWFVIPILLTPFFSYRQGRIKIATLVCISLLGIYLFFNVYYKASF